MYRVDLGKKLLEKGYNPFLALAAQETSDCINQRGGDDDILCMYGGNKEELQESWDYAIENKMTIMAYTIIIIIIVSIIIILLF